MSEADTQKRYREDSVYYREVTGYNQYSCETHEIYCNLCKLFVGHAFEDGKVCVRACVCARAHAWASPSLHATIEASHASRQNVLLDHVGMAKYAEVGIVGNMEKTCARMPASRNARFPQRVCCAPALLLLSNCLTVPTSHPECRIQTLTRTRDGGIVSSACPCSFAPPSNEI